MGTLIAWVLVRDTFPGKRLIDTLIDLPFALPTIVAGLVLLSLYGPHSPARRQPGLRQDGRAGRPALRHAAVRRAHGAARAASSSTRRWRRPRRRSAPAGARSSAGSCCPTSCRRSPPGPRCRSPAPSASSASTVLISGNIPFKTQVAAVHIFSQIESDNTTGAAAVSTSCCSSPSSCSSSLDVAPALGGAPWLSARCAGSSPCLPRPAPAVLPVGLVFWRTFEHGAGAGLARADQPQRPATPSR